ncbi:MAG: hypothetical protein AAB225_24590 [Acidobacteriota bacterium]
MTPTSDLAGKLRLVRSGTLLSGYYWSPGGWVLIHTSTATTADLRFNLGTWSHDWAFADSDAQVAFDNVMLNQGQLICPAPVDIKPGTGPNAVNPKSEGKIPVAILASANFSAATVNPVTVRFGATGTEARPVHYALQDVDADGDNDLILQFNTQDTGLTCGATRAVLTGATFGGIAIRGANSVQTVGCR